MCMFFHIKYDITQDSLKSNSLIGHSHKHFLPLEVPGGLHYDRFSGNVVSQLEN